MENATFLICGPLNYDTYSFYCKMYPGVKKVFSTWKGNSTRNMWSKPKDAHGPEDVFLENKFPKGLGLYDLRAQLESTICGLERVKTKFLIRLRGDEWFSNLGSVLESMSKEPGKIQTIPVSFRSWSVLPYHLGTHLLGGTTDNIRNMYTRCAVNLASRKKLGRISPESYLCKGYLDSKLDSKSDFKEGFKNLFGIVPLDSLKYYKVYDEVSGKIWYSNFEVFNSREDGSWERSISSMDEI